jgi:hypothetical protein
MFTDLQHCERVGNWNKQIKNMYRYLTCTGTLLTKYLLTLFFGQMKKS